MKLLSSLVFQIIVFVVTSFLLLFQSSEAGASSQSQKDAQDEKKIVPCKSDPCLVPVGHTLRIDVDTSIRESLCISNGSQLRWEFNRNPIVLNNGTNGFRSGCFGRKHWLIKDNVKLSDSGNYSGVESANDKHNFEVQVVDVNLQWHSSDDNTHVLITMNYSDIATTGTSITNSSCWYKQTNSIQQFTTKSFWVAFIFNVEAGKAFDEPQLCCQFSVAKNSSKEKFSKIPGMPLQIGQCNQTAVPTTFKHGTPASQEDLLTTATTKSSSEMIKSSTFPTVVLLFLAFSFHQRYFD